jgi:hypothetical protein
MSAIASVLRRPVGAAPVRAVPRLELVGERLRSHVLAYTLLTVLAIAASVFGAVALNATAADAAVAARDLERRISEAERQHAELLVAVSTLEDPTRIRELALGMGLVPAGPARHVTLVRALPADGAHNAPDAELLLADELKPILSVEP